MNCVNGPVYGFAAQLADPDVVFPARSSRVLVRALLRLPVVRVARPQRQVAVTLPREDPTVALDHLVEASFGSQAWVKSRRWVT